MAVLDTSNAVCTLMTIFPSWIDLLALVDFGLPCCLEISSMDTCTFLNFSLQSPAQDQTPATENERCFLWRRVLGFGLRNPKPSSHDLVSNKLINKVQQVLLHRVKWPSQILCTSCFHICKISLPTYLVWFETSLSYRIQSGRFHSKWYMSQMMPDDTLRTCKCFNPDLLTMERLALNSWSVAQPTAYSQSVSYGFICNRYRYTQI